jgi:hypothetical protein
MAAYPEPIAGTSASGFSESLTYSRPSRPGTHFPVDATSAPQTGPVSGEQQKLSPLVSNSLNRHNPPLRPNRNVSSTNGRRRVRSADAADVPLGTPRPHRTPVYSFVTPSRRPDTEARIREDNSGFGTFSNEYDLCESL